MITFDAIKKYPSIDIQAAFEIQETGISVFFGDSGSGKTSIINMLAGLVTPTSGSIKVNGTTLFDSEQKITVPPEKRNVGYVFQDSRLFPHMSVRKNLLYGADKKKNDIENISSLLGIRPLLDRYPENLSGGEKQRIAIGRALLSTPKILLMDEPMASLDSSRRDELLHYIAIIPRQLGIPVVYVTHTLEEILRLADNVGLMNRGQLQMFGPTLDVLNSKTALAHLPDKEFGSVWEGTVISASEDTGLGLVDFGGGKIEVASGTIPLGAKVRFRIPALDVVLSTERTHTVARNIFEGTIREILIHDYFADVLLDISGTPLWTRITQHSFNEIAKKEGDKLYATVKSVVASSQFYIIREAAND